MDQSRGEGAVRKVRNDREMGNFDTKIGRGVTKSKIVFAALAA